MLSLNNFFQPSVLRAFCSDDSVDFTLTEEILQLSGDKQQTLRLLCGGQFERFAWAKQVHGCDVWVVDQGVAQGDRLPLADALITQRKNTLIAVRTADCLPIFVWDPTKEAIGVIHAGWKSTQKRILAKVVDQMRCHFGSTPQDLQIAFGPAIRVCCYQVSDEFRNFFPRSVNSRHGQLYMDLVEENRRQFIDSGGNLNRVYDSKVCTCCSSGYFSYRRDAQKAGRLLSGMMIKGGQ